MVYEYGSASGLARELLNKKSQEDGSMGLAQQAQAANAENVDEESDAVRQYWLELKKKQDDYGLEGNENPYAYTDARAKFANPFA